MLLLFFRKLPSINYYYQSDIFVYQDNYINYKYILSYRIIVLENLTQYYNK